MKTHQKLWAATFLCALTLSNSSWADSVEDFYRGKVATVLVGVSVGGE